MTDVTNTSKDLHTRVNETVSKLWKYIPHSNKEDLETKLYLTSTCLTGAAALIAATENVYAGLLLAGSAAMTLGEALFRKPGVGDKKTHSSTPSLLDKAIAAEFIGFGFISLVSLAQSIYSAAADIPLPEILSNYGVGLSMGLLSLGIYIYTNANYLSRLNIDESSEKLKCYWDDKFTVIKKFVDSHHDLLNKAGNTAKIALAGAGVVALVAGTAGYFNIPAVQFFVNDVASNIYLHFFEPKYIRDTVDFIRTHPHPEAFDRFIEDNLIMAQQLDWKKVFDYVLKTPVNPLDYLKCASERICNGPFDTPDNIYNAAKYQKYFWGYKILYGISLRKILGYKIL
ncbi:MAG: hypothetical protein V1859_03635 [archaeon]